MEQFVSCETCGDQYSLEDSDECPQCEGIVTCETCGEQYSSEDGDECPSCKDEFSLPDGAMCEHHDDARAVGFVDGTLACADCIDQAYPID